jgi:hypothetical protein
MTDWLKVVEIGWAVSGVYLAMAYYGTIIPNLILGCIGWTMNKPIPKGRTEGGQIPLEQLAPTIPCVSAVQYSWRWNGTSPGCDPVCLSNTWLLASPVPRSEVVFPITYENVCLRCRCLSGNIEISDAKDGWKLASLWASDWPELSRPLNDVGRQMTARLVGLCR